MKLPLILSVLLLFSCSSDAPESTSRSSSKQTRAPRKMTHLKWTPYPPRNSISSIELRFCDAKRIIAVVPFKMPDIAQRHRLERVTSKKLIPPFTIPNESSSLFLDLLSEWIDYGASGGDVNYIFRFNTKDGNYVDMNMEGTGRCRGYHLKRLRELEELLNSLIKNRTR